MVLWSQLKREDDIVVAVWPEYRPLYERWFVEEMVLREGKSPLWRDRYVETPDGHVKADVFEDLQAALRHVSELNRRLRADIPARLSDAIEIRSTELKADKAVQSRKRRLEEEMLMLAEARRRHTGTPRLDPSNLRLHPESEQYREEIGKVLAEMPYLRTVMIGRTNNRYSRYLFYKKADDLWSRPYPAGKMSAITAERAKISDGFDLNAQHHWGHVKARIRKLLLPRANQLLQLASVQRLLAEALARGERVLVSNGIVFWYEPDGNIGWLVKETSSTKESDGATVWKEGTILSVNHGRLVILPYIKENGEEVRGHTKNGPGDGKALPRHPDHYVEIPFSYYDGDLMIGLFGELPYE